LETDIIKMYEFLIDIKLLCLMDAISKWQSTFPSELHVFPF